MVFFGPKKEGTIVRKEKINKILAVRNDRFGEFLLNIPALRALKESYPKARLVLAVDSKVKELAGAVEYADEVAVWDEGFRKNLRKQKFDLSIVLNPTKEAHLACFFAGIPIRAGYDRKCGFLLTHKLKDTKHLGNRHEVECNLELAALVDAKTEDRSLSLKLENKLFPGLSGVLVAVHPFTSDPVKQWPQKRFMEVAERLAAGNKISVVLVGKTEGEGQMPETPKGLTSLIDKTSLVELAQLLRQCRLLVSADSGPMHLAASVGTPVIALFRNDLPGKTAKRWGPWGDGHIVIERPRLEDITAEEVLSKIEGKLK